VRLLPCACLLLVANLGSRRKPHFARNDRVPRSAGMAGTGPAGLYAVGGGAFECRGQVALRRSQMG